MYKMHYQWEKTSEKMKTQKYLRRLYKNVANIDNALWVYRVFTDEETYMKR